MTRTTKYLMAAGVFITLMPLAVTTNHEPITTRPTTDTLYYLTGRKPDFEFLRAIVASPDDFSNNQRKQVLQWIAGAQVIPQVPDSLKKKP